MSGNIGARCWLQPGFSCLLERAGRGLRAVSSAAAEHIPASVPQTGARLTFSDRQLPGLLPLHTHARAGTRAPSQPLPFLAARSGSRQRPPVHRWLHPFPWLCGHRGLYVATGPTALGQEQPLASRYAGEMGQPAPRAHFRDAAGLHISCPRHWREAWGDGCPGPREQLARGHAAEMSCP